MPGLTYDSGALVAAERDDRRMWRRHGRGLSRGIEPVVPAVVLAQVWRGGPQPLLARLLSGCRIEPFVEATGREVGAALARSGTSDVVDGAVVVGALRRTDTVVTGDRADLLRIAHALGRRVSIIDV